MTTDKYLTYRGDLRAIEKFADALVIATVHPEGLPSILYRLDVTKLELEEFQLPCGGVSLAVQDTSLWISGDDSKLYFLSPKAKTPKALKAELPAPATALATLNDAQLAAICDQQLLIIDGRKGTVLQQFELPDRATSVAADPTSACIAVGMNKGHVSVYQRGEAGDFQISGTEKLHDGAVTSLLFEPEELRFLSAGADGKLLLTHASGKLEPEDRGRGASHSDVVTAMLHVPGDRFITVSRDKSCKTWTRAGATRPATFNDSVPAVIDAAMVEIHERPQLVLAGADNTLRFVLIDAGGRFGSMTNRLHDSYDRASHLLSTGDVSQRGEAIHSLADIDDSRSLEILGKQVQSDADAGLRLKGCELLTKSKHPRAVKLLEPLLKHSDDKVRLTAFEGLCAASEKGSLAPLELALKSGQANVGVAAVEKLETLAKKDDQSRQLLIRTFNNNSEEVRHAALLSFEKVVPKDSPEPTVLAAKSKKADTRILGLIRAWQRGLLSDSRVAGTVRRSGEDKDADVRRTSFLIALLSREKLVKAIRERDKELHRQIFDLENYQVQPTKTGKAKQPPKVKPTKFTFTSEDYEPLLSAMTSQASDTCLLGARCLALLQDARALGTLLQLSREPDEAMRVEVCRALAALADPRAAQRLETLAHDSAEAVRDAAYTALEKIYSDTPLEAADTGLQSSHIDVRVRGLKTLATTLQKSKKKTIDERARELMLRALNDPADAVSGEAFKTSLGLKIDGSADGTLRFALNSVRPGVRSEVLTEAMAHDKQDWAQQLLLDLLNDPASQIRLDAYEHLLKKDKGRNVAPMQAALNSQHSDVRLRATDSLVKLKTKAAQEALVQAIGDDDPAVRSQALEALIDLNAVEDLQQALSSRHTDIRLQAACVLAVMNDPLAKTPLLQAATSSEPERKADLEQWLQEAVIAFSGLSSLGDPETVPDLIPLLESSHDRIRINAAIVLCSSVKPDQADLIRPALQHEDPQVSNRIALALAFCEDPTALPVVMSHDAAKVLSDRDRLMAAVAFGERGETQLITMLNSSTAWIRNAAFLILVLRDQVAHDGGPSRIMTALSAGDARLRLAAAEAIKTFTDETAFEEFLTSFFNDRGDQQAWEITTDQITVMQNVIVFGSTRCRVQAVEVLEELTAERHEQWDFRYDVFTNRYQQQCSEAEAEAARHEPAKLTTDAKELAQLAFGTYVGLVREQKPDVRPAFGKTVTSIRREAIRRLVSMAADQHVDADSVRPVLIQALSDDYQAVRSLAFERLPEVGCEDTDRAAAAIECGHIDLAIAAFELLASAAGKKGKKVLEDVVLSRDDDLASEAGLLLKGMTDTTTAANAALESPHSGTRELAVTWLSAAYEEDSKAKKALIDAYQSRYPEIRHSVAMTLGRKKDDNAFDMLMEQLLLSSKSQHQTSIANALKALGDPRTPEALLDLLEADREQMLTATIVFSTISSFRQPDIVGRLLPHLDRKEWKRAVSQCILKISGHDQPFDGEYEEDPDRSWMDDQHPRHDDVLADYLETCLDLNQTDLIQPSLETARWSLSDAVDRILPRLCSHPDEQLRQQAVFSVGWRFRFRNGPSDALVDALQSRDTETQFLAAEGLAQGGKDDGINVLLSAVELMPDLYLRTRAVEALGELADDRALEILLRLVNDDTHALQDAAASAIGHLGATDKADEIFEILERLAKSSGSVSSDALVGLRHLDTPLGWDRIREVALSDSYDRDIALEQLGYNDTPESKQILLDAIPDWIDTALPAARRLFGEDSLEPDYAALTSEEYGEYLEGGYQCLKRVCADGDPQRILQLVAETPCAEDLAAALLRRDPLPVDAALENLDHPNAVVTEVASSIVGQKGLKTHAKPLAAALMAWQPRWEEALQQKRRSGFANFEFEEMTQAVCRITWALGRTGGGRKELLSLLDSHTDEADFAPVRRAAALALSDSSLTKTDINALQSFLQDSDPQIRNTIAAAVSQHDQALASKQASTVLADRRVFRQLELRDVNVKKAAQENAGNPHYQAIVLPDLVSSGEVKQLYEVASSEDHSEAARLGAVEGLARIAIEEADNQLVKVGNDSSIGEEIRKAAWRGLRRSKRMQTKAK